MFHQVAELAQGAVAADAQQRAAEQWLAGGYVARGLAEMEGLLATAGLAKVGRRGASLGRMLVERARLRSRGLELRAARVHDEARATRIDAAWALSCAFALVDPFRAGTLHAVGLREALDTGDTERAMRALAAEVMYSAMFGMRAWGRTRELLRVVDRLADVLATGEAKRIAASVHGVARVQVGLFEAGSTHLLMASEGLERREGGRAVSSGPPSWSSTDGIAGEAPGASDIWQTLVLDHFGSFALYYLGQFDELVARVEAGHRQAVTRKNRHRESDFALHHATVPWLLTEGAQGARARATRALAFWSGIGPCVQHYNALVSRASIALFEGEPRRSFDDVIRNLGLITSKLVVGVDGLRVDAAHLVARASLAVLREGFEVRAAASAVLAIAALALEQAPHARPLATMHLGVLAHLAKDRERALGLLERARRDFEAQGLRGYAAACEGGAAAARGGAFDLSALEKVSSRASIGLARLLAPGLVA
ncbi:MAG: hypothetical protein U0271_06480 [Polyangiaceae bacterium]